MKRIFSSPILALAVGACLRLFFALKFPGESGDAAMYEQLATNWLTLSKYAMNINGQPTPVDLRMPGYPAFLALVYALSGRTGVNARLFVMLAQVFVDLASCLLIACLAALLLSLCDTSAKPKRAFLIALWLAALCPFTANYVSVPLTEVCAMFFTAFAMLILVIVITLAGPRAATIRNALPMADKSYWPLAALAGLTIGFGTLFRPEAPLFLITSFACLAYFLLRRREFKKLAFTLAVMGLGFALPLVPWTLRNARTLHEFQPIAPKDLTLPGEVAPLGFMAWERTWLYRFRDCYLVSWKLNSEAISFDDIPPNAFDSAEEKARVAALLEKYNDDSNWTAEEDSAFAQLARERTARHPLRTYLWIPLRRAVRIWLTPRIELLPVSGNVFPLAYMREHDPVDQETTILFFFLNIAYVALALVGLYKLSRHRAARPALAVLLLYILVRTAFLTTLETPEPRYVLVCFPAVIAFAAFSFLRLPNPQP